MNIVFVCGGYYPNTSATGNCVKKIADMFTAEGHSVYVICKSAERMSTEEVVAGQKIYRITNKRLSDGVKLRKVTSKNFWYRIRVFLYKVRWALYGLIQSDGMDAKLVRAYYEKLLDLSNEFEVQVVVPCCMPAECLKAAYKFKIVREDCLLFPLLYDLYSENMNFFRYNWSHSLRKKKAERLEKDIFGASKKVFYVDNWKKYFEKHCVNNSVRVEHPLVVKKESAPINLIRSTGINAIYQGEVNYQMRPPKAMIKAFKYLSCKDANISLHVCAYGNAAFEIKDASMKFPDNIFFYGMVDKKIADGYYDASDIAVILANKEKTIVPSKIFECVASGYPIVYFFYDEDEQSYKLLKKYPLVYFFRQSETTVENYNALYKWIIENKNKRVEFAMVKKIYTDATPDYVFDVICKYAKE